MGRPTALRIQSLGKLPEGPRARLLSLADDWQHVGRVLVCFGLHGGNGALAGHMGAKGYQRRPGTDNSLQFIAREFL
jgi:hypothetical protein